jgi:hypothetical protein
MPATGNRGGAQRTKGTTDYGIYLMPRNPTVVRSARRRPFARRRTLYVYFDEVGRAGSDALLTRDEARRIALTGAAKSTAAIVC